MKNMSYIVLSVLVATSASAQISFAGDATQIMITSHRDLEGMGGSGMLYGLDSGGQVKLSLGFSDYGQLTKYQIQSHENFQITRAEYQKIHNLVSSASSSCPVTLQITSVGKIVSATSCDAN